MRSLKESISGMVDLGVVLMIGIAFVGLMVVAYIIFALKGQLVTSQTWPVANVGARMLVNQTNNITKGFDQAIQLILVAITIWILAIAISALLILRGRQE